MNRPSVGSQVAIRAATPADFPAVARLTIAAYRALPGAERVAASGAQ
jgi:hypothetical protein